VDLVAFPQYREEVEAFLAQHPNPSLRVHWVTLSGWDPWDLARGERGIRLHYLLWLGKAYRLVKNLASEARFPVLVHHVSLVTVSAPPPPSPSFPLVWGPVGGGQRAPRAFRSLFGRDWPKEVLRSLRVASLPWWPGWRSKVAGVSLVLATNRETLELLRRGGARRTELFLDSGVPPGFGLGAPPHAPREPGPLRLLWAGCFEPIKALPLAPGFVVERSVKGVAEGLRRFISLSPELRRRMGEHAREAVAPYGVEPFVEAWRGFYGAGV
jgi:hypothetical protein